MTQLEEIKKIHELIKEYAPSTSMGDFGNKELLCTELLDWHKKQVMEKVVEWIKENCYGSCYIDYYDPEQSRIDTDNLINDLKEYMGVSI
jgi:hypothetical protein